MFNRSDRVTQRIRAAGFRGCRRPFTNVVHFRISQRRGEKERERERARVSGKEKERERERERRQIKTAGRCERSAATIAAGNRASAQTEAEWNADYLAIMQGIIASLIRHVNRLPREDSSPILLLLGWKSTIIAVDYLFQRPKSNGKPVAIKLSLSRCRNKRTKCIL